MTDLPLDVRERASEAARKVDRDYGHWQDWVGSIDEFQHERALSTVDAVVAVVAPEITRPLKAENERLKVERDAFKAASATWAQRYQDLNDTRLAELRTPDA